MCRFHASRAGACHHATKTIAMAVSYALLAGRQDIRDTLLHEIAHAIVGPTHHHDRVWKAKAREIGCSAERCTTIAHSAGRWIARCTSCSRTWVRHRLTARLRRGVRCDRCGTPLAWKPNTDGVTG